MRYQLKIHEFNKDCERDPYSVMGHTYEKFYRGGCGQEAIEDSQDIELRTIIEMSGI
jgi:hypothetical protein